MKIKDYTLESPISADDRLLGTVAATNATRNFRIGDIANSLVNDQTLQEILDNDHDLVNGNNFQGTGAGFENTGENVVGFGPNAAYQNDGENIFAFGSYAAYGNLLNGQTIFSNSVLPSYTNPAAAVTAITILNGASANCTYLYFDDSTDTIKAIRL